MPNPISLSNIDTDFEQLKSKLVAYLQTQDSWQNALTGSTGNILTSIIAYNGVGALFAIEAAFKEAFPDTAKSDFSILGIAKTIWGNHILRKRCAKITVTLSNTTGLAINIPSYSQLSAAGNDYFNRTAFLIAPLSSVTVDLFQGTLTTETKISSGVINEKFYLGNASEAFVISDDDIFCIVNTADRYEKTTTSLFETGPIAAKIFYENTLPTGEVEVTFGDGLYGLMPVSGSSLVFNYAVTTGKAGNGLVNISDAVTYSLDAGIEGVVTVAAIDGDNEKDTNYYKNNGAFLRAAQIRGGGVSRTQYKAIALGYPGVADCNLLGQAETFPGDKNYMNVVTAVILADPLFTAPQFADFVLYMQDRTIDGLQFIQVNPTPINTNIVLNIFCSVQADPAAVGSAVNTYLQNLKVLKEGMLGFSFFISDLEKVVRDAVKSDPSQIDYFTFTTPTTDLITTKTQYVKFNNITVNSAYTTRNLVLS